ncbi:hypothetical protein RLOC_00011357 [Lonchura striata]|uniref:Uncharacterized protein n=1 Tax=Lonchura striata TaxID=40157 RepID=A0A218UFH7_9PASE|nr:hypothetical protein RLOC_00011357 [Lonchura striata domestica]
MQEFTAASTTGGTSKTRAGMLRFWLLLPTPCWKCPRMKEEASNSPATPMGADPSPRFPGCWTTGSSSQVTPGTSWQPMGRNGAPGAP